MSKLTTLQYHFFCYKAIITIDPFKHLRNTLESQLLKLKFLYIFSAVSHSMTTAINLPSKPQDMASILSQEEVIYLHKPFLFLLHLLSSPVVGFLVYVLYEHY